MQERFFSTIEVAKLIGISRIAVFKQIKNGKIKALRAGRNYIIHKEEVLHLLHLRLAKGETVERKTARKGIDSISS